MLRDNSRCCEILVISHDRYTVEITTFGGGIKSLSSDNKPLTETYSDSDDPPLSSGVILAPWPNRTADGTFIYSGQKHQLELTEPARNNAIHGLVHNRLWNVKKHSRNAVTLKISLGTVQGWPWPVELEAQYVLKDDGLHAHFRAFGTGPFGWGWHTYLSPLGEEVDRAVLTLNVDQELPLGERNLPAGELKELSLPLSTGVPIAGQLLDNCYYASKGPVRATVAINGRGVAMECSDNVRWFQVFTPDSVWGMPYPGRDRAIAIEPMTVPPNALNTGIDSLDAHEPFECSVRISAL
ncbi:aldose epimerase [Corynebacterium pseudotuberculosis]|uniref:aldose epimerase family protein n=1 Tax=Corynebacterium pseudotuberculosis TaxID=1719 RepID=UPI000737D01B|nr:aldose epimerase [Corynebacterium pseudotuberculosis]ALU22177.1 aldose epimerase [Corynebacterium pseudotuberculosis]ANH24530.1 Aldose 1-epimerase [Corynebacterium pseudotuberculosis]